MDTVIVVMLKDKKTGLFVKELETLSISQNEDYLLNIYAEDNNNNNLDSLIKIYMRITTKDDVLDWQFDAIYDYYDTDIFYNLEFDINEIREYDQEYNPTWEVCFDYNNINNNNNLEDLITKISVILQAHKNELDDVFKIIHDKQGEYI